MTVHIQRRGAGARAWLGIAVGFRERSVSGRGAARNRPAARKMEGVPANCRIGSTSADGQSMARAKGSGPRVTTRKANTAGLRLSVVRTGLRDLLHLQPHKDLEGSHAQSRDEGLRAKTKRKPHPLTTPKMGCVC